MFFAPSIGELERLADILQEYSVPFQLGLEPANRRRSIWPSAPTWPGAVASTYLVKGVVRARRRVHRMRSWRSSGRRICSTPPI